MARKEQHQKAASKKEMEIIEMTITDIIGKGKPFEPPFHTDNDGMYIWDKNNQMMLETRGFGHLQYLFSEAQLYREVYPILAQHICNLLNREHCEDENQRRVWLVKCCDVVRNTNISDDIKSHLINTFMRL